MRFAPALLSFIPWVWGDYWILDLADDYSYAAVGDPDRTYLWILARSPAIDTGSQNRAGASSASSLMRAMVREKTFRTRSDAPRRRRGKGATTDHVSGILQSR